MQKRLNKNKKRRKTKDGINKNVQNEKWKQEERNVRLS